MDHPIRELTAFLGLLICGCSLEGPVLFGRVQVSKKNTRQDEIQHRSRQSRQPVAKVANTTGPNSTGLELSPSMGLWRTNSNEDHSQKTIRLIAIFDAIQRGLQRLTSHVPLMVIHHATMKRGSSHGMIG
ncbi:hypothetical protein CABS01_04389 [Colletotrichum abscissum]|uniref:Secreted protein n=1 Tax=Colletotrichum melonis TaxID=1209925 RepID=A0AAI9XJ52_9PEZI|nr:uncharacterized protein CABS01_04389 [Colletotrichum abscissum]KAK1452062.1 hypothetical protein CMEL01_06636 [Colletotrichum melonis]KAK1473727.1 hypothetical protein CABS01_04389 [Colletotrichum abscissum]